RSRIRTRAVDRARDLPRPRRRCHAGPSHRRRWVRRHVPHPYPYPESPMSRILIVEDEERIASFLAKGLTAEGFTTTVVADGVTGLDYAVTGEFDLVVLDIGLPGLDGFSVLDRLKVDRPELPVIVLTARDSVTDTVTA